MKLIIYKILRRTVDRIIPPPKVIYIYDEYVEHLCAANAGLLHKGNLYCFDYVMQNLPSENPVVEIGTFCGLSTNVITYYLRKYGKANKVITSDKWIIHEREQWVHQGNIGNSTITHGDYRKFLKDSYMRNVRMFSSHNRPYTIEQFSDDFFEAWAERGESIDVFGRKIKLGGEISFCYIDGNHRYEYAKRDFENTDRFLEKGGYILFDDTSYDSKHECTKLMPEVMKSEKYELVIKNPNYLFRKVK